MSKLTDFLSKRIPTILGILFLAGGLGVGIFVVNQGTGGFLPKASPESTPKNVKITNISDTTFTISFLTDSATPGYVKYGTEANKLQQQTSDDRDQLSGSVGQFTTHHITLRNLTAATPYYVAIGTASREIYTDNGKPYMVTTAPKIGGAPEALTAYGSVVTKASTPANDSIVYVSVEGASPLSTLVKSSGSWAIPLSTARTKSLSSYISTTPDTLVDVFVQGKESANVATAKVSVAKTQPVATITLGQQGVDLTGVDAGTTATPADSSSTAASGSASATSSTTTTNSTSSGDASKFSASQLNPATESTSSAVASLGITFSNPSVNGEELNTTKPALQGKAPAKTVLSIEVHSDPVYKGSVTTDANGNWSFTPSADLKPGDHTITVSYKDANGKTVTEKRTFKVLAMGTSTNPAFTSTPSASPSPSPTSSASARVKKVASGSAVPKSGAVENTYMLLLAGVLFMFAGLWMWHYAEKDVVVAQIPQLMSSAKLAMRSTQQLRDAQMNIDGHNTSSVSWKRMPFDERFRILQHTKQKDE